MLHETVISLFRTGVSITAYSSMARMGGFTGRESCCHYFIPHDLGRTGSSIRMYSTGPSIEPVE